MGVVAEHIWVSDLTESDAEELSLRTIIDNKPMLMSATESFISTELTSTAAPFNCRTSSACKETSSTLTQPTVGLVWSIAADLRFVRCRHARISFYSDVIASSSFISPNHNRIHLSFAWTISPFADMVNVTLDHAATHAAATSQYNHRVTAVHSLGTADFVSQLGRWTS